MHPYRSPPTPGDDGAATPNEEWVLAVVLLVIGAVRVAIALVSGEDFATDVTLAAILGAIGLILLAQLSMRAVRAR